MDGFRKPLMNAEARQVAAIVNPAAGRAQGAQLRARALAELARLAQVTVFETERPGHATELAAAAAREGFPTVAALGGDGTFREVGAGLIGTGTALAPIPTGSGSDFCRTIGTPRRLADACRVAVSGTPRQLDAVRVEHDLPGVRSPLHYVNVAGFGFDAAVVAQALKSRHLRGLFLYVAAVFRAVRDAQCPTVRLTASGRSWEQPILLVAAANCRYYGGGMRIAPAAEPSDGLLDICLIDRVGRLKILRCLPSFVQGTHGRIREVHFLRTKELELEFLEPVLVQLDGDLLSPDPLAACGRRFRLTVMPGALAVRT